MRGVKSSPIQFRDSKFPKVNHRNRGIKNRRGVYECAWREVHAGYANNHRLLAIDIRHSLRLCDMFFGCMTSRFNINSTKMIYDK